MKLSGLSVFFPCFNEAENVEVLLQNALSVIPHYAEKFELIVINDGSRDNTKKQVLKLAKLYPQIKLINHQENLGYGAALKSGFKAARYPWVFFTDADLQFDLKELKEFIPFTKDYQAIIGFRLKRAEGKSRTFNAKLFKSFIDLLFRVHVKDIDCAFKLFATKLVQSFDLESNGAFLSAELLYKLKKQNVKFKQIAVHHYPRIRGNPTGANLKVIIKAILDAMKLYLSIKFHRLKQHQW